MVRCCVPLSHTDLAFGGKNAFSPLGAQAHKNVRTPRQTRPDLESPNCPDLDLFVNADLGSQASFWARCRVDILARSCSDEAATRHLIGADLFSVRRNETPAW